jgi:hypothetical protein
MSRLPFNPGGHLDPSTVVDPNASATAASEAARAQAAFVAYRALEAASNEIQRREAYHAAIIQAQSSVGIIQANIAASQAMNPIARWVAEGMGIGPGAGVIPQDQSLAGLQGQLIEQTSLAQQKQQFIAAVQTQAVNPALEAVTEAGLHGYRPSVQIQKASQAGLQAAKAQAQGDKDRRDTVFRDAEQAVKSAVEAGEITPEKAADLRRQNAAIAALATSDITEGERHAQVVADQGAAQAAITQRGEAARSSAATSLRRGSEALRAGAGGADVAFTKSQEAAMTIQKEEQAVGRASAEETAALASKQGQEKLQREREIAQRVKDVTTEGQQAQLQTEGQFYDARRVAFERAAQDRLLAARELGQKEIAETIKTNEAQRALMEKEIAHEIQVQKDASNLIIDQTVHRANADTLRAKGEFYKADEAAYKSSWDEKIIAADNAILAERDPIKQANLRDQRDALDKERTADEAAREYTKPGGTRDLAIRQEQIEDTRLQARGQYQTEQLKQTTDKAYRAIADAAGKPELQKSIADQAKADIEKQEFDIKRQGMFQLGRSARHSFELTADSVKPLENLNDVMSSADKTLKSIDDYLRQQVAKTVP